MTILSTVYASAPSAEVMIPTLMITARIGGRAIRTCAGYEDLRLGTRGDNLVDGWERGFFGLDSIDEPLLSPNSRTRTTLWFAVEPETDYAVTPLSGEMDRLRVQWRDAAGVITYQAYSPNPGTITSPADAAEARIYYASAGVHQGLLSVSKAQYDTYTASGLDVSLPKRDASGQQNLNFAIENVTGQAQDFVDRALTAGVKIEVICRNYLASDLSMPAEPPLRMVVVGASMKGASLQVTASYQDIIGRAWPRERYNATDHPGLRYL